MYSRELKAGSWRNICIAIFPGFQRVEQTVSVDGKLDKRYTYVCVIYVKHTHMWYIWYICHTHPEIVFCLKSAGIPT